MTLFSSHLDEEVPKNFSKLRKYWATIHYQLDNIYNKMRDRETLIDNKTVTIREHMPLK